MWAEARTFPGREGHEGVSYQVEFLAYVQPEGMHFGALEGHDTQYRKQVWLTGMVVYMIESLALHLVDAPEQVYSCLVRILSFE
jgi:hypothetical protein